MASEPFSLFDIQTDDQRVSIRSEPLRNDSKMVANFEIEWGNYIKFRLYTDHVEGPDFSA